MMTMVMVKRFLLLVAVPIAAWANALPPPIRESQPWWGHYWQYFWGWAAVHAYMFSA